LGLSPGQDFESRLFAKPKAGQLLAQELRKPGYAVRSMALGTNTDPYQPIDDKYQVTRDVLKVLRDFRHPVGIVTKSNRILRDLDILSEMASMNLARVAISVTTLDRKLARSMEPRAPTPERRIDAANCRRRACRRR
jgi:DNA repair photolyase